VRSVKKREESIATGKENPQPSSGRKTRMRTRKKRRERAQKGKDSEKKFLTGALKRGEDVWEKEKNTEN